MPALMAAWRAGFCPTPAVSTWPRITSDTCSGATPARPTTPPQARGPPTGGEHLAQHPLRPLLRRHARALEHPADDERAQIGGRGLREAAAELADGGARRADDDDFFHDVLLIDSLLHIAAGGRFDGPVLDTSRRRRCGALAAPMAFAPSPPNRPPA